ncbi:MAG: hypothetical protein KAS32_25965 [Candidatus Peribacteraceae bacterium]|nr:hypothetical protein [Candidatus Peribacteraceae bacterium]
MKSIRGIVAFCLIAALLSLFAFSPAGAYVTQVGRDWLIEYAVLENCTVNDCTFNDITYADGSTAHTDTIEVTNAQILDLADTAVELVAAPGAGYTVEVLNAVLILDYGSAACAEPSAPDDLAIGYDGETGSVIATWDTTAFITGTADMMEIVSTTTLAGVAVAANVGKSVDLYNSGGDYTTCTGSTMTVIISYKVHATGL